MGQNTVKHSSYPKLRIGSKLLEDAFGPNKELLLKRGERVSSEVQLNRLLQPWVRFGESMSCYMPIDLENEAELDAKEQSSAEKDESRLRISIELKNKATEKVKSLFTRISRDGTVDVDLAMKTTSSLIDAISDDADIMLSLSTLKDADQYTFTHSVNVSILAGFLCIQCGYSDRLHDVATGALLHDIGKISIPEKILHKSGPLEEVERNIIMDHPTIGLNMLCRSGFRNDIVLSCVIDHHEKVSGRGYPRRRPGHLIGAPARIVSIVDIYDALTTDRPYRRALTPFEALSLMSVSMGNDLDRILLSTFVDAIGVFLKKDPMNTILQNEYDVDVSAMFSHTSITQAASRMDPNTFC